MNKKIKLAVITREDPQIHKCEIKEVEGNIAAIISRISAQAELSPPTQQTRQQQQQRQGSQPTESTAVKTETLQI